MLGFQDLPDFDEEDNKKEEEKADVSVLKTHSHNP